MKKTLLYIILAGFTLYGCTPDCCDCDRVDETGNFRLIRDWGNLWVGVDLPESTDLYLYHTEFAPVCDKTYTDTSYYDLPAGEYHILAVNEAGTATYNGMDNYYTAQICLSATQVDNAITTTEAPLCFVASGETNISGKTDYTARFTPINKIINFTFMLVSPVSVSSVNATLDGVQISAPFCAKETTPYTSARLPFQTKETQGNKFQKSLSTLGLSDYPLLTIRVNFADHITQDITIDLTGKFNFRDNPVQNCIVYLSTAPDQLTAQVNISPWQPGIDADIDL